MPSTRSFYIRTVRALESKNQQRKDHSLLFFSSEFNIFWPDNKFKIKLLRLRWKAAIRKKKKNVILTKAHFDNDDPSSSYHFANWLDEQLGQQVLQAIAKWHLMFIIIMTLQLLRREILKLTFRKHMYKSSLKYIVFSVNYISLIPFFNEVHEKPVVVFIKTWIGTEK